MMSRQADRGYVILIYQVVTVIKTLTGMLINSHASRPFDRTSTVHARDQRNMRYSGVWPTHASLVVQLSVSCPAFPIKHATSYKPYCCLNLLQHLLHKHE